MGGGQFHSKEVAFLVFPKIYFDVTEIYRQRWLEESGQRPENVDQTKWQVASGKWQASTTKKERSDNGNIVAQAAATT